MSKIQNIQRRGREHSLTIINLDTCNSTNEYIKSNHPEISNRFPLLLISSEQTKGRGRGNNLWYSPRDKGLYASLAMHLSEKTSLNLLPLTAGIAITETLGLICQKKFKIKWPNDIIYQDKKIAGILTENIIQGDKITCICGMGINLYHDKKDFPPELKESSISLKMITGSRKSKKNLISILLENFFYWIHILEKGETKKILDLLKKVNYFKTGDNICLRQENKTIDGIFFEMNQDGGITLETKDRKREIYYSGNIQVIG